MRRILNLVALLLVSLPPISSASGDSSRPAISGIAYVRIKVSDLDKATAFYGGTLGLSTLNCAAENAKCYFLGPGQEIDLIKADSAVTKDWIDAIGLYAADAGAMRKFLVSNGQKPGELITDSKGMVYFRTNDPESHAIEFIQTRGMIGSMKAPLLLNMKMIHSGFVVKDRAATDKFYKDLLGFKLYWHGGMKDNETSWVAMQVPDGTDWVEYMLNIPPDADKHLLGVMNHISLGVPDVQAAAKQLEAAGVRLAEQPKIGRDGKWQLNLYDPDFTRVELMEYTPVEKPCCSEFTGPHPKP